MQTSAAQDATATAQVALRDDSSERVTATAPGLEFPRYFTRPGVDPFDEVEWELRAAVIGNEKGHVVFEQRDVEIPRAWSQQATNIVVSKYFRGQMGTPERERSVKQLIGRVVDHDHRLGAQAELLPDRRRPAGVLRRPQAPARLPEGRVQQPRLVQLRFREGAAVLGVLHQLGRRHDGLHPDAGAHRGHAVQVRVGHRLEPVADPLLARAARRRRHGQRPGVLHEGLRRLCRRHQVRRQDAARGQDGDPQRRSSGHHRVHQLQGRGREEGLGAHRRRLRRLVHGHGLRVGLLPELEQLRARHRRVHARACSTTARGRRMR